MDTVFIVNRLYARLVSLGINFIEANIICQDIWSILDAEEKWRKN
jgi:hypothetical protein